MKNRHTGLLIIGIAGLIGFIIFSFNQALTEIVNTSCEHGTSCPMWGSINFQTNISLGIMAGIIAVGVYITLFVKDEPRIRKLELKKPTKEEYAEVMKSLDGEENKVLEETINSEGTIFQSDLVEKSGLNKVKVTRILDKLEGKGIVERKRRGMTNVVILKQKA